MTNNCCLLGILETNFSGRRTRNDRNILKSTSTLASAKTVIELHSRSCLIRKYYYCCE